MIVLNFSSATSFGVNHSQDMSFQANSHNNTGFTGNGSSKHSRSSVSYPDQSDKFEKFIFVTPSQSPEEAAEEVIEHLKKQDSTSVSGTIARPKLSPSGTHHTGYCLLYR